METGENTNPVVYTNICPERFYLESAFLITLIVKISLVISFWAGITHLLPLPESESQTPLASQE